MPQPRRTFAWIAIALMSAALAGCLGGGGTGSAAVYVKDAPRDDFESLFVTFSEVRVHQSGSADANSSAGWLTLVDEEHTVDLLAYSDDDSRAFLGKGNLSAGRYQSVVITLIGARGVLNDGSEVDVEVSSGKVRLVQGFDVRAGETTRIVLDFDLDKPGSVVKAGDRYRLTPVVGRVTVEERASGADVDRPDEGAPAGNASGGMGTMTVYVKDKVTDDFAEVWITFAEVSVHRAGGGDDAEAAPEQDDGNETGNMTSDNESEAGSDGDDALDEETQEASEENETPSAGWIVVVNTSRSVNLLDFSEDGSRAFLGEADLAAGRYTQIRLDVTAAWGITPDGERVDFTVLKADAKIIKPFTIAAGETTQVVIDVDLDRSLVASGPPDAKQWKLTPVIGTVAVENDAEDDPMADLSDSEP